MKVRKLVIYLEFGSRQRTTPLAGHDVTFNQVSRELPIYHPHLMFFALYDNLALVNLTQVYRACLSQKWSHFWSYLCLTESH